MKRLVVQTIGSALLDALFPLHCVGCGHDGSVLCKACQAKLTSLKPPYCHICASQTAGRNTCEDCSLDPLAIDGIRAPYLMDDTIRKAIYKLKYQDVRAAGPGLGRMLGAWLKEKPIPGDHLVPVPLHHRRMRDRGYNQSALLAKEVAALVGLPVKDALERTRDTPAQVGLGDRDQRALNVQGGFRCKEDILGWKVILVDDVVTSGSTMAVCAQALKSAGAANVWGIALAR